MNQVRRRGRIFILLHCQRKAHSPMRGLLKAGEFSVSWPPLHTVGCCRYLITAQSLLSEEYNLVYTQQGGFVSSFLLVEVEFPAQIIFPTHAVERGSFEDRADNLVVTYVPLKLYCNFGRSGPMSRLTAQTDNLHQRISQTRGHH